MLVCVCEEVYHIFAISIPSGKSPPLHHMIFVSRVVSDEVKRDMQTRYVAPRKISTCYSEDPAQRILHCFFLVSQSLP